MILDGRNPTHATAATAATATTTTTKTTFVPQLGHSISITKTLSTALACVGAAALRYPTETWTSKWQNEVLREWSGGGGGEADHFMVPTDQKKKKKHDGKKKKGKYGRHFADPFLRVVLHEVATTTLEGMTTPSIHHHIIISHSSKAERNSTTTMAAAAAAADEARRQRRPPPLTQEFVAGAISGLCQALIICPLEKQRADERVKREKKFGKSWTNFFRQQALDGGTMSPKDRLKRAYHGIGLLAFREVVFNMTFFPLYATLNHTLSSSSSSRLASAVYPSRPTNHSHHHDDDDDLDDDDGDVMIATRVVSGIASGFVCAFAVSPLDALRTYFWHSGERFSILWGKSVSAPPWGLLWRIWFLQSLIGGPAFGVVAVIYDVTSEKQT